MMIAVLKSGSLDLGVGDNGRLLRENSLVTAVIVSLLTDRRAQPDDALPFEVQLNNPIPPDRRGWVGDAFDVGRIGSRLWLLRREKQTEETRRRAIFYATEALQWLRDEGRVTGITVTAAWRDIGWLDFHVLLTLPGGDVFETNVQAGIVYAV